ncbi:M14 family metallopeptidase [Piscinibacter sp. HJYY11]|uniref:M14 family metallopeptidase n=1 Tax=Piscinibacter sp. HJYY11 TaxID=2801333 RepID=UPI00191CA363|nr:M14 family metallopeptidase [Piscinibacter sp. HJYY11]MBL0728351.1 M14 family metallopeptidase [Piscinibacter sp. HJYY11]
MADEVTACFAQTYAAAREKFLDAAESAHLDVHSEVHTLRGRDGETLALDVVRDGPADAKRVLLVSSGCHGVEGFCGSGIQVAMLHDVAWQDAAHEAGVAVVYLHALNPYGFSWWRRVTHENVDLNRNFQDFTQPLPRNTAYDEIAHLLVPPTWPARWRDNAGLLGFLLRRGVRALQAAVSAGQYEHADGLFYGGREPTWSHMALRRVLREHGRACEKLGWIDLHTGLGKSGVGERIFAGPNDAAMLTRARDWWGERITSIYDGSSTSAPITGMIWSAALEECPQAEYTGIALEYGTQPLLRTLQALRAEQWLQNHPEQRATHGARIKQQMRDAFYTDTDDWKHQVVMQAMEAAGQALAGLAPVRN